MAKKKPKKPPVDCYDCLDCSVTGCQETYWNFGNLPGPHYCDFCGKELVKREVKEENSNRVDKT